MPKYWALGAASAASVELHSRHSAFLKPIAGGLFAFALLLAAGNADAIIKGPSGCPTGTTSNSDDPNQCDVVTDFPTVTVVGPKIIYYVPIWALPTGPLSTVESGADHGGQSLSESGVRDDSQQKLQDSDCDGQGGNEAHSLGAGVVATGKPVVIATGNKILPEGDIQSIGDGVALELMRVYSARNTKIGSFGQHWTSSLDYTLVFEYSTHVCWTYLDRIEPCTSGGEALLKIHAYNPSGYATHFSLANGIWTSDNGDTAQLVNSEWIVSYADGSRHVFAADGRPKTIRNERGIGLTYTYNSSNQLSTVTHTAGRSLAITWSNHKIVSVMAPNGKAYGYAYNASGYLSGVTYPDNLGTRTYHYESTISPAYLTGISLNGERYSRYQYLADGKVQWSGLEGGAERSNFVYYGDRTVVTNALGQATTYYVATIDGSARVSGVQRPVSGTCSSGVVDTAYNADGTVDYEVDATGVKRDYTYDSDGRPTQIVTGIGLYGETDQQQITQYVWDSARKGRLAQVKVFGNNINQPLSTTTYTYFPEGDARARLLQSVAVVNQGGGTVGTLVTTYSYTLHPNGLIATMTVDGPLSGTGDSVVSTFDTAGNLLTVTNSLGHTTTYANYNALGEPGKITSPNGAVTTYTYNARGQVLTETMTVNGAAQTTTTTYDARGRPVRVVRPDGYFLDTSYDAFDRVTSIYRYNTLPDSGDRNEPGDAYDQSETRKQEITYNLLSQPLTSTTTYTYFGREWDETRSKPIPLGYSETYEKVTYEYDAGGFLSKRKGEHGQSLTYHYNANGDVDWVQDALGNKTSYGYDRHRRVSSITDPKNGVTTMTYDATGQVKTVRDARGNTTTYAHDGLGNLLTQASPDTGTTAFTYNALGQRTQMQRADLSTTSYTYDSLGRLKTTASGGQTRTLTYDTCTYGKGLLCSASKTGGNTTSTNFTYTPWGQVATRQDVLNGVTDSTTYSYDGMLRLAGIVYPSGISVAYGYAGGNLATIDATVNGATSRIASIGGYQFLGPATRVIYGNGLVRATNYDTDRRITGISTSYGTPIQSMTYGFDAADRITAITNGVNASWSLTLGYDGLSRLTSAANPGGNSMTLGFDAAGNRITRSDTVPASNTTYTYSSTSNRLQNSVQGTLSRTYTTNAVGDTTAFTGADGVANTLTYDPFGRLASHTRSGVTTTYTVNALDQRVAKAGPAVADTTYIYGGQNQLLAERNANGWTSYLWNGNEPVALVRNNQIYYLHTDHLGRPQLATNASRTVVWKVNYKPFNRDVNIDSIGGFNFGNPGQYLDTESGLWHNGYRDYDWTTGRYLQSDPIGLMGGINTYNYVGGNPISSIDPLGLLDPKCIDYLGAAFGIADTVKGGIEAAAGVVTLTAGAFIPGSDPVETAGGAAILLGAADVVDGLGAIATAFDGEQRTPALESWGGALLGPHGAAAGKAISDVKSISGIRKALNARTAGDVYDAARSAKEIRDSVSGESKPCGCN